VDSLDLPASAKLAPVESNKLTHRLISKAGPFVFGRAIGPKRRAFPSLRFEGQRADENHEM
jgi:hypothetical protein